MKKLLFVLLVSIASITVFADDRQPSPVAVSDVRAMLNETGNPTVSGLVTNVSSNPVKEVFVKFNLYDEQGNLVGNAIDHASNLEPGGRWVFNALSAKAFYSFKMTSVDTY